MMVVNRIEAQITIVKAMAKNMIAIFSSSVKAGCGYASCMVDNGARIDIQKNDGEKCVGDDVETQRYAGFIWDLLFCCTSMPSSYLPEQKNVSGIFQSCLFIVLAART